MFWVVIIIFIIGILLAVTMNLKNKKEQGNASLVFSAGLSLVMSSSGSTLDSINYMIGMLFNREGYQQLSDNFNFWLFSLGAVLMFVSINSFMHAGSKLQILSVNAYRHSDFYLHAKDLKLDTFDYKELDLDFVYLYKDKFENTFDEEVFDTIMSIIPKKITQFQQLTTQKGYTGIAPIPFIMYIGRLLNRVRINEYYEFDRNKQKYISLSKWSCFYPRLKGLDSIQINDSSNEVVLTISITQSIREEELVQFEGMDKVHIKVDNPSDNLIKNKKQLKDYAVSIYQTIEKIGKEYPNIQKIHFVCSSQSCLPLEIGKLLVEGNRIPTVICYHYNRAGQIKYPWGIVQSGNQRGRLVKA